MRSKIAANLTPCPEPDPSGDGSSVAATQGYTVEPITTDNGLANLKDEWNRVSVSADQPNVFTTCDWFRIWNQHTSQEGDIRRPNVLVVRKNGVVVALSPLIYREAARFGCAVRKLEFVGRQADYNDLVVGNDLAAQTDVLVDFLARTRDKWDLIELRDLRETGNTLTLLERTLSRAGLIYRVRPEERCPYLAIDGPWSKMLNRLSSLRAALCASSNLDWNG